MSRHGLTDLRYGWEPLISVLRSPNLAEMIRAQNDELGVFDGIPLEVSFDYLLAQEAAGLWRGYTVRDGKTLAGWVAVILAPHSHHAATLFAKIDNYYLDPAYRRGRVGLDLLGRALAAVEDLHPRVITIHEKLRKERRIGIFFERLGFEAIEMVYAKVLPGERR